MSGFSPFDIRRLVEYGQTDPDGQFYLFALKHMSDSFSCILVNFCYFKICSQKFIWYFDDIT